MCIQIIIQTIYLPILIIKSVVFSYRLSNLGRNTFNAHFYKV